MLFYMWQSRGAKPPRFTHSSAKFSACLSDRSGGSRHSSRSLWHCFF